MNPRPKYSRNLKGTAIQQSRDREGAVLPPAANLVFEPRLLKRAALFELSHNREGADLPMNRRLAEQASSLFGPAFDVRCSMFDIRSFLRGTGPGRVPSHGVPFGSWSQCTGSRH